MLTQVEGVMTADRFAGHDPILVLNFLYSFEHACDDCDIAEPTALQVLKHFLVARSRVTFPRTWASPSTGRGAASIYPDAIYWLLLN